MVKFLTKIVFVKLRMTNIVKAFIGVKIQKNDITNF